MSCSEMKRVNTNRELQLIELVILKDFAYYCRENGIQYNLDAGTLIGAVRHKGFIPWDDDIDICMSRPNYEKLVNCTMKTKGYISDRCKFINPETSNDYYGYIPLVVYLDSKLLSKQYRRNEDLKISISLFVYDGIPNSKWKQLLFFNKLYFLRACHALCRADFNYVNTRKAVLIGKALSPFCGLRLLLFLKKEILKYQKKYDYETAIFLSANTDINPKKLVEKKDDYEKQIMVEFEKENYTTYSDYDRHLRVYYGDYMIPPKEEERNAKHNFEAWYNGIEL